MTSYTDIQIILPPEMSVVTLDFAKRHGRIDESDDMDLLELYIHSAVEQAEKFLNRSLITRTIQMTTYKAHPANERRYHRRYENLFDWENWHHHRHHEMQLLYSPVTAVISVTVGVWGEADVVLTEAVDGVGDYTVDVVGQPARIRFQHHLPHHHDHISVIYTAGYGTYDNVPASIKTAILIMTLRMWENRGEKDFDAPLSGVVRSMLSLHRQFTFP